MVRSLIKKVIQSLSSGSKKKPTPSTPQATSPANTDARPILAADKSGEVYRPARRPRDDHARPHRPRGEKPHSDSQPPREKEQGQPDRHPRRRPPRAHKPDQGERGAPPKPSSRETAPVAASPRVDKHEGWTIQQYDVPVAAGKTRFYDLNLNDRLLDRKSVV